MAIKSKTQLSTDIAASKFTVPQQTILTDMVDSYEDIFPDVTTVQRDALTPVNGQIVYNTDNDRYEYWNGAQWLGIGQDLSTPLTVKVDLSSADILALNTTPITLVAAPGAGYALMPISALHRYTYGTSPYTVDTALTAFFSTKAEAQQMFQILSTDLASANSSELRACQAGSDFLVENDSIILKAYNTNPTVGDGTLTVWLTYAIIAY